MRSAQLLFANLAAFAGSIAALSGVVESSASEPTLMVRLMASWPASTDETRSVEAWIDFPMRPSVARLAPLVRHPNDTSIFLVAQLY